jgi:phosphatidylglycerol:prolipoprotein diacylglycerol transferase
MILGIILGGRLGYVLFYEPARYMAAPLDALKIWQGGMSFHGGMLGVAISVFGFHRRFGVALLPMADVLAVAAPFGLMLGRIANFINAELWGRPTDMPWGVIFPGYGAQECGQALGALCARHPSQLYEAALEGLILGLVLLWLAYRRAGFRRPGMLFGIFLAGYAVARFAVEFVRVADEQFVTLGNPAGNILTLGTVGLSMGQVLSLPMFAVGIWLVLRSRRAVDARA